MAIAPVRLEETFFNRVLYERLLAFKRVPRCGNPAIKRYIVIDAWASGFVILVDSSNTSFRVGYFEPLLEWV